MQYQSRVVRFFSLYVSLLVLATNPSSANALPFGDPYLGSATNLIDDYSGVPLTFDGLSQQPDTEYDLNSFREQALTYPGIPGGILYSKADGSQGSLASWQQPGHIIEFELTAVDGEFISFEPASAWSLTFQDIDLDRIGGAIAPHVVGAYLDFNSGIPGTSVDLPYMPHPVTVNFPYGFGFHPMDEANGVPVKRRVFYTTYQGIEFDNALFGVIAANKLTAHVGNEHFAGYPLETIVVTLGLTPNFRTEPYVSQFVLGLLVTGLSTLPGDYDCNGIVNSADLTRWRNNHGLTSGAGPCSGDGDGDGDVDGNDFLIWQRTLGLGNPPSEPAVAPNSMEKIVPSIEVLSTPTPQPTRNPTRFYRPWVKYGTWK